MSEFRDFEAVAFGFYGGLVWSDTEHVLDPNVEPFYAEEIWQREHYRHIDDLQEVEGAGEFVYRAFERMRSGLLVVNSAPEADIKEYLKKQKWNGFFASGHIVGRESGGASGPDPAPYREALNRTGLQKEQKKLLVVENSGLSIEAARKSGAVVVGLSEAPGGDRLDDLLGIQSPNFVVANFHELGEQLGFED